MNPEAKKWLKRVIPTSLGLLALAACSTSPVDGPTVEEIKSSMPQPKILTSENILYTQGNPIETIIDWENTCLNETPVVAIAPTGPIMEWTRVAWLNPFSPKKKLKVSNFTPNTGYDIQLSGVNCTQYAGEVINTDAAIETIKIIYDTIPPTAEVEQVVAQGGKLFLTARVTDNLSGPEEEIIQRVINNPAIGTNKADVNVCDLAGKCQKQTLEGNYDPFNQAVSMSIAKYDPNVDKIVIHGTIFDPNSNIDLAATDVNAKQSVTPLPSLPGDIDKMELDCSIKGINGFDFTFMCTPVRSDGRTIATIQLKDKVGHTYNQTFEVEIPPLSNKAVAMYYSLLALGFLTSSGLYTKVRSDRHRRERREELVASISSHERENVVNAFQKLTKKDRKKYIGTLETFNQLMNVRQLYSENKLVEALAQLKEINKKSNVLLEGEKDKILTTIIAKINKMVADRNWRSLEKPEIKVILDFLSMTRHNRVYAFPWDRVENSKQAFDNLNGAVILYSIRNGKMNNGELAAYGMINKDKLKEILALVVQWGDFESVVAFVDKLVNKEGKRKTSVMIAHSTYTELRLIVDSMEEVTRRSLENKLKAISEINDFKQVFAGLEEFRKQYDKVRLYKINQKLINERVAFIEKRASILKVIGTREAEIIENAKKFGVLSEGILMKRISNVFDNLKSESLVPLFLGRKNEEIDAYICGMVALNAVPLAYFTGARYRFEGDIFTVDNIPNPKFANVPYHVEGKFAQMYDDKIFRAFLADVFQRVTSEYVNPEKHHKSSRVSSVTYDLFIPIDDAATYGKADIKFVDSFLNSIGISPHPNHKVITEWLATKLKLVAK